ncbi:MAG: universal stress protein, partial [Myxococcota bacterium]
LLTVVSELAIPVVSVADVGQYTCTAKAYGRWPAGGGAIVVPVDFSDEARAALSTARRLAGPDPIRVVHIVDAEHERFDPDADTQVRQRVIAFTGAAEDEVRVAHGRPDRALVEYARDPEVALVVVGTHALHTALERMLGTMAVTLTRRSHAPVLTVR